MVQVVIRMYNPWTYFKLLQIKGHFLFSVTEFYFNLKFIWFYKWIMFFFPYSIYTFVVKFQHAHLISLRVKSYTDFPPIKNTKQIWDKYIFYHLDDKSWCGKDVEICIFWLLEAFLVV